MSTTIRTLSHNQHYADIKTLLELKASRTACDAESRRLKTAIDRLKALLFQAMRGAISARCGNALINIKPEKRNPGCLTLKDGRAIPLSELDVLILKDQTSIKTADVEKWFGGSTTGADLEITIIPDQNA
jgi:hypothetical protein